MRAVATICSFALWFLGGIFVLAAFHPEAVAQGKTLPRLLVGGILLAGGAVIAAYAWRSSRASAAPANPAGGGPQEPPGPLSLKAVTCPHCGGQVDPSSAKVGPEGTLTLTCAYCHGTFLVQEDPKW